MSSSIIMPSTIKPENKVIGFSGSPRKNGNSDLLLKNILLGVNDEKVPNDFYNLTDIDFKGCIGCERCRKTKICTGLTDGLSEIYPKIISSKGLVLVSPTHNYNITSWMKAFIDRLYCFYNFENTSPRKWTSQLANQNRKAIIATICEQEKAEDMGFTIEAMKTPLEALGYEIIAELRVFNVFAKAKVKQNAEVMEKSYRLGQELAKSLV